MKLSQSLGAAAFALAALSAQAQSTNLVLNGSFESGSDLALTDWTLKQNGTVAFSYDSFQDGLRSIDLDNKKVNGRNSFNSSISQTITGTGLVNLSFWYAANPTDSGSTNEVKFAVVFGLGNVNGSVLGASSNSTTWQRYTQLIDLGTSGTATLSFAAAGSKDYIGGYIDDVSVTAVPEPEYYAMLLAGLGLMGTIALRRNKNKAG